MARFFWPQKKLWGKISARKWNLNNATEYKWRYFTNRARAFSGLIEKNDPPRCGELRY
jgi:hypothetical protein